MTDDATRLDVDPVTSGQAGRGESPGQSTQDIQVTEPGVYDMPDATYHADPVPGGSLSSTGARKLLPPGCPAAFRYWADHPEPPKPVYDHGKGAHLLVLGIGPAIREVKANDWRTKRAQEERAAAYAAGEVPLLTDTYNHVKAMAAALREHPTVRALFNPDRGRPEQSLFWVEDVWRRARLDWLPERSPMGRVILADYKTCDSADREAIERAIDRYGYHQQADWYKRGARALGLAGDDAAFLFVFQEKAPPYLVNIVEPDPPAMRIGADRNRRAVDIYRRCVLSGRWPSYSGVDADGNLLPADDVQPVGVPAWVERRYMREEW